MGTQTYFEEVQEGNDLPALRKDPTPQQLVKYAGASGAVSYTHLRAHET